MSALRICAVAVTPTDRIRAQARNRRIRGGVSFALEPADLAVDPELLDWLMKATPEERAEFAEANGIDLAALETAIDLAPKQKTTPKKNEGEESMSKVNAASKGRGGLQGADLEEFRRKMGTTDLHKSSAEKLPHRNADGHLVLPTIPPREAARLLRGGK